MKRDVIPMKMKTISRNLFHEKLHIFLLRGGGLNRGGGLINFFTEKGCLERGAYLRGELNRGNTAIH